MSKFYDIQTTDGLREDFINYFRENNHKYMKPCKTFTDDPTLFFTTAGMVPLKKVFLGQANFDDKYSRLANSQICVRAGGKHNDLDDVGFDTYHLTSFSMLGNWSLNNYWKEEAILLALNYLVKCGLDKNRMYATYFEGNDKIPEDIESRDIWLKYLDSTHVIKGSTKDNFWSLGSGPCGPCTEIHYDLVQGRQNAAELVNKDDPLVIEIWNLVLMQYDEIIEGNTVRYELLTKRFVDTGAGLERLAMVLQNKTSIYQTDVFVKLIKYVEIMSNKKEYKDVYGIQNNGPNTSFRIFADHFRTLTVTLYDGARFDCNGRGFILRKIARRLLLNFYIYLNDCVVSPVFSHHIIEAMITEILNYHMFYKHDAKLIKSLLVEEEIMFTGRLNKFKMLYETKLKTMTSEQVIQEFLSNVDSLRESHGVDIEVISVVDKLIIDQTVIDAEMKKLKIKN